MTFEDAKQELVGRYKYLYENACFILAPFMYEQTQEEFKETPLIYLKIGSLDKINAIFEEFLLSDKNIEDTILYEMVESKINDSGYFEQVKKGLVLLEKENNRRIFVKDTLDIFKILSITYDYILEQSGDLKNKEEKLKVLDEYYRIARYQNNGKIYTSGINLNIHDCDSISVSLEQRNPFRDKDDVGITKNIFITTLANAPRYKENWSIFTEDEKQKIYLDYHDELPCDLEIACEFEEEYIKTMIESRLYRPENTAPCGENFIIKEGEIFINPNDSLYRYYQVCPHCGYIVNIPKEILSEGIKQRIEDRCSKDEKLFRKMFLYSELFSLDKSSVEGQKRLLKR